MNNMNKYRKAKGYSVRQLSIMTGIPENTLWHIEKQESASTSVENMFKISRALGGTIEQIFLG